MLNIMRNSSLSLFTTDAETLTMMWQTVLLGMGMVFAVLAIHWFILSVFKLIFAGKTPKEPKPIKVKAPKAFKAPKAPKAPKPIKEKKVKAFSSPKTATSFDSGKEKKLSPKQKKHLLEFLNSL